MPTEAADWAVEEHAGDRGGWLARCFQQNPDFDGQDAPGSLIGLFERHVNVMLTIEEQRHVRQEVTSSDRLDVGHLDRFDLTRSQSEPLVRRQLERLARFSRTFRQKAGTASQAD